MITNSHFSLTRGAQNDSGNDDHNNDNISQGDVADLTVKTERKSQVHERQRCQRYKVFSL